MNTELNHEALTKWWDDSSTRVWIYPHKKYRVLIGTLGRSAHDVVYETSSVGEASEAAEKARNLLSAHRRVAH